MLFLSQKNVLTVVLKYEELFKRLERQIQVWQQCNTAVRRLDLWMNYCMGVQKLQQCCVEYVTGISALFQRYKTMDVWIVTDKLKTYCWLHTRLDLESRSYGMLYSAGKRAAK